MCEFVCVSPAGEVQNCWQWTLYSFKKRTLYWSRSELSGESQKEYQKLRKYQLDILVRRGELLRWGLGHMSTSWISWGPLNLMVIKRIIKLNLYMSVHTPTPTQSTSGWCGARYLNKRCLLDYLGDPSSVTGPKIPKSLPLLFHYIVDNFFFTMWQEIIWAKHHILPLGK